MSVNKYIRGRFFPHIWCPGCGHGVILNALLHTVESLDMDKADMCMVSGIGCSARISGYVDFHSLHTMHGRALACCCPHDSLPCEGDRLLAAKSL